MSTPSQYDPARPNNPYDMTSAPTPPSGLPAAAHPPAVDPGYPPDPAGPSFAPTDAIDPAAGGPATSAPPAAKKHSRTGAAWVALVVAAIVMIFLLIFILQNSDPVQVRYFGFEGTMSLGVAMMFAALAGALTAGLLGTVRILQLRARARRATGSR